MAPLGVLQNFRRASLIGPTLLALAGLAVIVSLGNWQMGRRAWKNDLIEKIAARGAMAPLGLDQLDSLKCEPPEAPDPELSCQFVPVRLRGTFDHSRERHVYGTLSTQPGRSALAGFYVFTPFRPEDRDYDIVVNRGFVPEASKEPGTREAGQIQGETGISAIIRRTQPRGSFDATDDPARNIYFVRDPVELGLVPRPALAQRPQPPLGPQSRSWLYVDLSAPLPPGSLPRPAPGPAAAVSNRHLEYALTWYGLAATLVGVFLAFARTRLADAIEQ